jgi:hypothetical protein
MPRENPSSSKFSLNANGAFVPLSTIIVVQLASLVRRRWRVGDFWGRSTGNSVTLAVTLEVSL